MVVDEDPIIASEQSYDPSTHADLRRITGIDQNSLAKIYVQMGSNAFENQQRAIVDNWYAQLARNTAASRATEGQNRESPPPKSPASPSSTALWVAGGGLAAVAVVAILMRGRK